MIKIYKIKVAPPVMHSITNRGNVTYNFRNLQEFQSERKATTFYGIRNIKLPWTTTMDTFARRI